MIIIEIQEHVSLWDLDLNYLGWIFFAFEVFVLFSSKFAKHKIFEV